MLDPKSIDVEAREFDLIWGTESPAPMVGWIDGEGMVDYDEELVMSDGAWDTARVDNGTCPLMDSHGHQTAYRGSSDTEDILGTVLSVTFSGGKGRARCRFSFDPEHEGLWLNVQKGIIRACSPRYRVIKYTEVTEPKAKRRTFRATKAALLEISLLPIPADERAHVRASAHDHEYTAELELDGGEPNMALPTKSSKDPITPAAPGGADPARGAGNDPQPVPVATLEPDDDAGNARGAAGERQPAPVVDLDRVRADERARVQGIQDVARTLRIDDTEGATMVTGMIGGGVSLDQARAGLLYERARRDGTKISASVIQPTADQRDKVRAGVENALQVRVHQNDEDGKPVRLTEFGREFRGMSLMRMAEEILREAGVKTRGMDVLEIASAALGMDRQRDVGGMMSSSDFPNLLANVANKTLRSAYAMTPSNWKLLSRAVTANDFKPMTRVQIGEAPALTKVNEHGEFQTGAITEGKESYALDTYGKILAITRKALINDDTSAFDRIPMLMGRAAAELENQIAIGLLLQNPTMGDGNQLISANHKNTTTLTISVASLSAAMLLLRKQTGLDGVTLINAQPSYLFVPAALEVLAKQFTTQITPAQPSNTNPFIGVFKSVIVEPRLDVGANGQTGDAVKWWMTADPSQLDMLEHAYLGGQEGVFLEQQVGWRTDGIELKVRHDFAVGVVDWRGFVRSTGV